MAHGKSHAMSPPGSAMDSGRRYPFPAKNDPNSISTFIDRVIDYQTSHRIQHFSIWERARLYYQDEQYLEADYTEDPTRTPFLKPLQIDVDDWQPMPIQNEMVAPMRNETSRIVGVGSRPYIRVEKDDPETAKAAKLAKDVLLDKFEKMRWFEKDYEGCHNQVMYGTWCIKSYLEVDYSKPQRIPLTTAKKCSMCDYVVATPKVPDSVVEALDPNDQNYMIDEIPGKDLEEPTMEATATHCPHCPPSQVMVDEPMMSVHPETGEEVDTGMTVPTLTDGPGPELVGFMPSKEQAKGGTDTFGRSLGEDIPLVDVNVRNVSVYDAFPENSGIDVEIGEMLEFGESHVESIDWIKAHYKNGEQVKPEAANAMMRWHPIVGGSQHFYGGVGSSGDPALFDHHARVREWHKKPWIEKGRLNKGRSLVVAHDIVLLDADYMIESKVNPGEFLPRVLYEYIPWELRDRETFGISASEWMFSEQDSINTERAQAQYARHIFGNPKIIAPDGVDLTYAGWADTGYSSDIWYYRPGPDGEKPDFFNGMQLGTEWKMEQDTGIQSIQRRIGTTEVEVGDLSNTDITAASALMYVGEKAAEGRKPRIQRIREAKKRIYRHVLQLMHEFYREERYYNVKDRNDNDATRSFIGLDLMGQTNVQLEDESVYDMRMFQRESVKEGLMLGIITADTESAKRKIGKILGIQSDINDEANIQVEGAEDEWIAFTEEGVEPYIDDRLDSAQIHYDTHARSMMSDKAQDMKKRANWGEVKAALAGWEGEFDMIEQWEGILKASPPTPEPPEPTADPLTGEANPDMYEQVVREWHMKLQMQQIIEAMPKFPEHRIMQFWTNKLAREGIMLDPEDPMPTGEDQMMVRQQALRQRAEPDEMQLERKKLLRFESHLEGHYRKTQADAQAAMMGAMQPAAPGAPETGLGMQPGPGDAAIPAPGAGPSPSTASGAGM